MTSKDAKKEEKEVVKFYSTTVVANTDMDVAAISALHADFQPLCAAYCLARVFDEISENKDKKDDAQKARLQKALGLLESKIPLASFPDKTRSKLLKGVKKQLK